MSAVNKDGGDCSWEKLLCQQPHSRLKPDRIPEYFHSWFVSLQSFMLELLCDLLHGPLGHVGVVLVPALFLLLLHTRCLEIK